MDLEAMITMTDRHEAIEGADYVLNMVHVSDVHPPSKTKSRSQQSMASVRLTGT